MGSPGPQKSPEPSSDQVEKAVKKVMQEDEMRELVKREARTATGVEVLEQALDTKEGEKAVSDSVKRALGSSSGRSTMQEEMAKLMEDPQFKMSVQMAIRQTMTEMLSKGTEAPKKGQGGGGQGGGAGGGGEGGGGGGGGGGGS